MSSENLLCPATCGQEGRFRPRLTLDNQAYVNLRSSSCAGSSERGIEVWSPERLSVEIRADGSDLSGMFGSGMLVCPFAG
jgi:hypothetical protein